MHNFRSGNRLFPKIFPISPQKIPRVQLSKTSIFPCLFPGCSNSPIITFLASLFSSHLPFLAGELHRSSTTADQPPFSSIFFFFSFFLFPLLDHLYTTFFVTSPIPLPFILLLLCFFFLLPSRCHHHTSPIQVYHFLLPHRAYHCDNTHSPFSSYFYSTFSFVHYSPSMSVVDSSSLTTAYKVRQYPSLL